MNVQRRKLSSSIKWWNTLVQASTRNEVLFIPFSHASVSGTTLSNPYLEGDQSLRPFNFFRLLLERDVSSNNLKTFLDTSYSNQQNTFGSGQKVQLLDRNSKFTNFGKCLSVAKNRFLYSIFTIASRELLVAVRKSYTGCCIKKCMNKIQSTPNCLSCYGHLLHIFLSLEYTGWFIQNGKSMAYWPKQMRIIELIFNN